MADGVIEDEDAPVTTRGPGLKGLRMMHASRRARRAARLATDSVIETAVSRSTTKGPVCYWQPVDGPLGQFRAAGLD